MCNQSTETRYSASSFIPSGINVTMNYGDSTTGTFASGPIGKDTATIAGLSVTNQQFASIDNTSNLVVSFGAAGIFGLGFPTGRYVTPPNLSIPINLIYDAIPV